MHMISLKGLAVSTAAEVQITQIDGQRGVDSLELQLWNAQNEPMSLCFDDRREFPDIDQAQLDYDHFCLYLYVPVGDGPESLLTQEQAERVTLKTPPGWTFAQVIDVGRYGVYWVLHPAAEEAFSEVFLNVNQGITVMLSNMHVGWQQEGMSVLGLRCGCEESEQQFLPLFVRYPTPKAFLHAKAAFSGILDALSFTWRAEGNLSKLYFLPDETEADGVSVDFTGEMECTLYDTTMYALQMQQEHDKQYCFCPVVVQVPKIISFVPEKEKIHYGQSVKLAFMLQNTRHGYLSAYGRVDCTTILTDGSACASGSIEVTPRQKNSRYRFYCLAKDALLMKECVVEIEDFLSATVSFLSFPSSGQGYQYHLNWSTENMLTISLKTSDGVEHSNGAAVGNQSFNSSTTLTLHVKLTGPGNQLLEYDY